MWLITGKMTGNLTVQMDHTDKLDWNVLDNLLCYHYYDDLCYFMRILCGVCFAIFYFDPSHSLLNDNVNKQHWFSQKNHYSDNISGKNNELCPL